MLKRVSFYLLLFFCLAFIEKGWIDTGRISADTFQLRAIALMESSRNFMGEGLERVKITVVEQEFRTVVITGIPESLDRLFELRRDLSSLSEVTPAKARNIADLIIALNGPMSGDRDVRGAMVAIYEAEQPTLGGKRLPPRDGQRTRFVSYIQNPGQRHRILTQVDRQIAIAAAMMSAARKGELRRRLPKYEKPILAAI